MFIVFLVSGFWHGANWTFIAWGGIHAILFLPSFVLKRNRKYVDASDPHFLPSLSEILSIVYTFAVVVVAWVFFRADSISIAFDYIYHFFQNSSDFNYTHPGNRRWLDYIIALFGMLTIEYIYYSNSSLIGIFKSNAILRKTMYILLVFCILIVLGENKDVSFIYFQF